MKRQNLKDERIIGQRRKINSEAYGILMIALFISMIVQQFILNAPFEQYAAESICFLGASIYVVVRYIIQGININDEGKQGKVIPLINAIVVGAIVTIINGIFNYLKYADYYKKDGIIPFIGVLIVTFISSMTLAFIVSFFVNYLNKKRQEKIQQQLDEAERDE